MRSTVVLLSLVILIALSGCATVKPMFPLEQVAPQANKLFDQFEQDLESFSDLVPRKYNSVSTHVTSRTSNKYMVRHRELVKYKISKDLFPFETPTKAGDMWENIWWGTIDSRGQYTNTPFISDAHTKIYNEEFIRRYNPALVVSYEDFFFRPEKNVPGEYRWSGWDYVTNYLYLMQDGVTIINLSFFNMGRNHAIINILHTLSTDNRITLEQIKGNGVKNILSYSESRKISTGINNLGKGIQKDSASLGIKYNGYNDLIRCNGPCGQGRVDTTALWMDNTQAFFSVTDSSNNRSSTRVPPTRNNTRSAGYSRTQTPSGGNNSTISLSGDNVPPIPSCSGLNSIANKTSCIVERSYSEASACKAAKSDVLNSQSRRLCGSEGVIDTWSTGACNCGGKEGAVVGCRVVYSYSCKSSSDGGTGGNKTQ